MSNRKFSAVISMITNISIIIGVIFAVYKININIGIEKNRNTVEQIRQTMTPEFIEAYTNIREIYLKKNTDKINEDTKKNFDIVINGVNTLSVLYIEDLINRTIINRYYNDTLKRYFDVFDFFSNKDFDIPENINNNFNKLKKIIKTDQ